MRRAGLAAEPRRLAAGWWSLRAEPDNLAQPRPVGGRTQHDAAPERPDHRRGPRCRGVREMTDTDKSVFAGLFSSLAVAHRSPDPDVVQMKVYFEALRDLEIEFVLEAAT